MHDLAVELAVGYVGINHPPRNREEYEIARKRVVNLLASKTRSEVAKKEIRDGWQVLQNYSPYRPVKRIKDS